MFRFKGLLMKRSPLKIVEVQMLLDGALPALVATTVHSYSTTLDSG